MAPDGEPCHRYTFEDGTVGTEFYRLGKDFLLRFPGLAGDATAVTDQLFLYA